MTTLDVRTNQGALRTYGSYEAATLSPGLAHAKHAFWLESSNISAALT